MFFSIFLFFTPSVSIVLQNGHPAAIILDFVSIASSVLAIFTSFFPFSDYNGLQRILSVGTLHDLCTGLFVLGIFIFVLRKLIIRT